MPFIIVRQDITRMEVDVVVNAANTDLAMGGGVCGAIFNAAGAQKLQTACDALAPVKTGDAAVTPAFGLPCRYIVHAVGPVYRQQEAQRCEELLYSAYRQALNLAFGLNCESIAFPLISSGIYGYPKEEALRVATTAIGDFLNEHEMTVYLAVFDKAAFCLGEKLLGDVASYIDEKYVHAHSDKRRRLLAAEREALSDFEAVAYSAPMQVLASQEKPELSGGLDDVIENLDEPFSATLLRLIDARGRDDVEVYKRANIDRKLFSKIRSGKGYAPSKRTVLAFAIALELDLAETDDLLERAGFALSHSQKFDVIIEYFIVNGRFDIFEINEVLFKYDLPLLGG